MILIQLNYLLFQQEKQEMLGNNNYHYNLPLWIKLLQYKEKRNTVN